MLYTDSFFFCVWRRSFILTDYYFLRYVEYWRQRFAKQCIDTIFPKKVLSENDELYGKADYYFEMGENLPEDYALRQKLAMRRLEEVYY